MKTKQTKPKGIGKPELPRLTAEEAKENMREAYAPDGRFRSLSERAEARASQPPTPAKAPAWQGSPAEQFLYNELELGIEGSANLRRSQQAAIIKRLRERDQYKAAAEKLAEALRKAIQHLDYCGYGDRWERECAGDLPKVLESTIAEWDEAKA